MNPSASAPTQVKRNRSLADYGKVLAVVGAILEVVGGILLLTSLVAFFIFADPPDPGRELRLDHMLPILLGWSGGFMLGFFGLVLLGLALFGSRYRAKWFFWFLIAWACLQIVNLPFGTVLGILTLIYCLTHREDFWNPGAIPAVPGASLASGPPPPAFVGSGAAPTTPPPIPGSPSIPKDQREVDGEHLRLLAILHFVGAGFAVLGMLFIGVHFAFFHTLMNDPHLWESMNDPRLRHGQPPFPPTREFFAMFSVIYVVMGGWFLTSFVLNLLSGFFLRAGKHRIFSIVVGAINCLHIPLGTALGVFTLIVLTRVTVRERYEGGQIKP